MPPRGETPMLAFLVCGLLPFTAEPAQSEESRLVQVLKDAQATNLSALDHGTMRFRVHWSRPTEGFWIRINGTLTWDGKRASWAYRLEDPRGALRDAGQFTNVGGEIPIEYYERNADSRLAYNARVNFVFINPPPPTDRYPLLEQLLDVTPENFWYRCFAPNHLVGRPLSAMLGEDSPLARPGSTFSIQLTSDDRVLQTRLHPDGAIAEATFSLKANGSLVTYRHHTTAPLARSFQANYDWRRYDSSTYVLKSYEGTESQMGRPGKPWETFRLDIDDLELKKPTHSAFGLPHLLDSLPKNAWISDQINKRTYPAQKTDDSADRELDALAAELRIRGFLRSQGK
jgi:hypothetical protein